MGKHAHTDIKLNHHHPRGISKIVHIEADKEKLTINDPQVAHACLTIPHVCAVLCGYQARVLEYAEP